MSSHAVLSRGILRRQPRLSTFFHRPLPNLTRTHFTGNASTVDPSEVSHFTALASEWWDPNGSSRILHLMNPIRIQFLKRCLAQSHTQPPSDGLRFLDVGCGGGILSESLARLQSTHSVIAIDPTPEVLRVAEAHRLKDPMLVGNGRLEYINTTVEQLPVPVQASVGFDVVTAMEVIEHVPSPKEFLKELALRTKPGGWLVLSTIARHWVSFLTTKVMAEGVLKIVPWGTHDWDKYVNVEEIRQWVTEIAAMPGMEGWRDAEVVVMGVVYVPGVGWKEVPGGEHVGNYFVGIRRGLAEAVEIKTSNAE